MTTPTLPDTLRHVDLKAMEAEVRRFYLGLQQHGITGGDMQIASGRPAAFFDMWLRGYRPIVKVKDLQAVLDAAPVLEAALRHRR
jgi:hypothetical protein